MATLQTLNDGEAGGIVRGKINDNFTAVNSDLATLDTNKLEASDIATINGNTISAGGNLVIPVLTDGDKGDITLTSSGTVWTIDNNVVTNAKLGTTATNTIKGRSTAGTGNVEDLTPTQVAGMLPVATTSVAGTMSASDKTKLDGLTAFIGCRLSNSTNQTLAADLYTAPVWNTEDYDVGGFHTGSNNYFTIPTTGYYVFTFNLNMDGATSGNFNLYITKNSDSSGIMSCQSINGVNASFADGVSVSGVLKCTSGDTVSAGVHLSGTSGNTRTMLATNSFFSASLIGI